MSVTFMCSCSVAVLQKVGGGGVSVTFMCSCSVALLQRAAQETCQKWRGGGGSPSCMDVGCAVSVFQRAALAACHKGLGGGRGWVCHLCVCCSVVREQLWRPVTRVGESLSSLAWLQQARRFQHDHSSLLLAESGEDLHLEVLFFLVVNSNQN